VGGGGAKRKKDVCSDPAVSEGGGEWTSMGQDEYGEGKGPVAEGRKDGEKKRSDCLDRQIRHQKGGESSQASGAWKEGRKGGWLEKGGGSLLPALVGKKGGPLAGPEEKEGRFEGKRFSRRYERKEGKKVKRKGINSWGERGENKTVWRQGVCLHLPRERKRQTRLVGSERRR